jgi:hypothetical protein
LQLSYFPSFLFEHTFYGEESNSHASGEMQQSDLSVDLDQVPDSYGFTSVAITLAGYLPKKPAACGYSSAARENPQIYDSSRSSTALCP